MSEITTRVSTALCIHEDQTSMIPYSSRRVVVRTSGPVVVLGLLAILLPASPAPLASQIRADTASVLFGVASDLLQEGDTTQAASLFRILLGRFPEAGVASDARALIDELEAARRDRGGRRELIAWSTIYGASLGVLIPAAFGADDSEPYGVGLLLGAPLGFAGSKAYANSVRLTPGQARAITFGSWWGMWQGFGWREVFGWGDRDVTQCFDPGGGVTECFTFREESDEAPFTGAVLGSLAGLTTGILLSRQIDIAASTALVANFGALWGTWYGFAASVIAIENDDDGRLAMTLVGGDVGLIAGALAAPALGMSTGRAWLVHLAGIAGLIGGLGLDLIVQPDDDEAAVLIPMATSAFGLFVGFGTTSEDSGDDVDVPELASALISWREGKFRFGAPLPRPTVLAAPGTRRGVVPGVKFDLFRLSW